MGNNPLNVFQLVNKMSDMKVSYSKQMFMRYKKELLSLQRSNMVTLWDKGVLTNPVDFNNNEILDYLLDLKIDIFNKQGIYYASKEQIQLILIKNKQNLAEEDYSLLKNIYNVVELEDKINNIDLTFSKPQINGVSRKKDIPIGVIFNNGLLSPQGILRMSPELAQSVLDSQDYKYELINYNEVLRKVILVEAGISETEYNKGNFFIDGLTPEEEVELLEYIFSGEVELTGSLKDNEVVTSLLSKESNLGVLCQLKYKVTLLQESKKYLEENLLENESFEGKDNRTIEREVKNNFLLSTKGLLKKVSKEGINLTWGLYAINANTDHDVKVYVNEMVEQNGNGLTAEIITVEELLDLINRVPDARDKRILEGVLKGCLPIEINTGSTNKLTEAYDIYQSSIEQFFNHNFGSQVKVSLGDKIYDPQETKGNNLEDIIKFNRNKFEEEGQPTSFLPKEIMICLQK